MVPDSFGSQDFGTVDGRRCRDGGRGEMSDAGRWFVGCRGGPDREGGVRRWAG